MYFDQQVWPRCAFKLVLIRKAPGYLKVLDASSISLEMHNSRVCIAYRRANQCGSETIKNKLTYYTIHAIAGIHIQMHSTNGAK